MYSGPLACLGLPSTLVLKRGERKEGKRRMDEGKTFLSVALL